MSINAKDRIFLDKILEEISVIEKIVFDSSEDTFLNNKILQRATVMALLNIGELVAHLSQGLRSSHGCIPWKKIIGLRNLAAHGYFILDMSDIWHTIGYDIPELKNNISQILTEQEDL
ncbi:MAG: DUF86 domain-containing protein [Coriobacteriales bacterium]|jgi:uncharacterized protein with HEPN domain|nr:DUF86 domain-containing protein [Coriobacteriales bacterium]